MGAAGTGAGACSSRRGWVLLLLLNARSTRGVYWGEGWEDPVSKQLVNRALRVVSNDSSIPMEELTDYFDWLYFEGSGGVGKVKGIAVTVVNAPELRNSFSIALAGVGELTGMKAVEYALVVF